MVAMLSNPKDTAVCYDQGYMIPMSTQTINTTGTLVYSLYTDGYNPGNVDNVQADGDYNIVLMDQSTVLNHGDSIENVTYHFLPVIRNTGPAGFCEGSPIDSIKVQVAPELKGNLEPDTYYIGGNAVRCYGLEDVLLHSNVRGGYYLNPYQFDWDTDGGSIGNMVPGDSVQNNMGEGNTGMMYRMSSAVSSQIPLLLPSPIPLRYLLIL